MFRYFTPVCSEMDHQWSAFVHNIIHSADNIPAIHTRAARLLARLPQVNRGLNNVHRYASSTFMIKNVENKLYICGPHCRWILSLTRVMAMLMAKTAHHHHHHHEIV